MRLLFFVIIFGLLEYSRIPRYGPMIISIVNQFDEKFEQIFFYFCSIFLRRYWGIASAINIRIQSHSMNTEKLLL